MTAGCVKAGLKVVRIGRPEATRFDLEKYNLLEMVKVWLSWLSWLGIWGGFTWKPDFFWGHSTIGIVNGQQDSAQGVTRIQSF